RLLQACGEHVARFAALDVAFAEHHPSAPHQHQAFMAVHPRQQQRGRGSALLADHHRQLDAAGVPAYLEAANLRAARLYGRRGYRILDRIDLPGGPSMWPVCRGPGGRALPRAPWGGGAVLPGPRRFGARSTRKAGGCWPSGRVSIVEVAVLAIAWSGWFTVVSRGENQSVCGRLSLPTTDRSRGTP